MKYKLDDDIKVIAAKGRRPGTYVHGGNIHTVPINAVGKITEINEDHMVCRLPPYSYSWALNVDEIALIGAENLFEF